MFIDGKKRKERIRYPSVVKGGISIAGPPSEILRAGLLYGFIALLLLISHFFLSSFIIFPLLHLLRLNSSLFRKRTKSGEVPSLLQDGRLQLFAAQLRCGGCYLFSFDLLSDCLFPATLHRKIENRWMNGWICRWVDN